MVRFAVTFRDAIDKIPRSIGLFSKGFAGSLDLCLFPKQWLLSIVVYLQPEISQD